MGLKLQARTEIIKKFGIRYLTSNNKPLSIAILLLLLILLSFAKPLLALTLIVTYGLVFMWAVRDKH